MKTCRIAWVPALATLTVHCAGAPSAPQTTVSVPAGSYTETSSSSSAPGTHVAAQPPAPSNEPAVLPMPPALQREGGLCAPFAPVKSTDTCAADADCAPADVCHARSCASASKAPKRAPGTMCTMNLVCQSIDVGKCACVDKVCALVSR
jgi:hypothetical protein